MPKFSEQSLNKLNNVNGDLVKILMKAIEEYDFTVIYGYRTPEEQYELFKQGRENDNGEWRIVNSSQVVTPYDGINHKSNHNFMPSRAVDIAPYPIDWEHNLNRFQDLSIIIKRIAKDLNINIKWGGDFKKRDEKGNLIPSPDMPHYELI